VNDRLPLNDGDPQRLQEAVDSGLGLGSARLLIRLLWVRTEFREEGKNEREEGKRKERMKERKERGRKRANRKGKKHQSFHPIKEKTEREERMEGGNKHQSFHPITSIRNNKK
jgi:hypothetical protein